MKKLVAILICVIMAVPSGFVLADTLLVNTVKVNVNAGTVVINDEEVESAAVPYVNEAGVTMMEFYTLSDAMGATVTENEGVFTVGFEDVSMTYTLNSNMAVIAGQELTMPSPLIRNHYGVVMAPLRFVAEALGADVSYNGETGEIIVMSAGGMDEGINFQLLFKYAGKTKIGHSKEHWRFTKSDNFDMNEDYGSYMFAMDDISINLFAMRNVDKYTPEQIYIMMQQEYSYGLSVIYEKGIKDHKGIKCVYVKRRYVDYIEEQYAFITDEYVYDITIERDFETFSAAKNDADVNAFIESLEFDYNGGDEENTVDIFTVDFEENEPENKKGEYIDGNYSWSIKLSDTWEVEEYYGFYNVVTITRPAGYEIDDDEISEIDYIYGIYDEVIDPTLTITAYSNPEKQSLSDWAKEKYSIISRTINSEFCELSSITDYTVNGRQAKVFEIVNTKDETQLVTRYYYLNDGAYRYSLSLVYNKKEEEVSGFKSNVEALIQSFTPGEINAEEVGDALEPDSDISALDVKNEYSNDQISLSYPCLWSLEETGTGVYVSSGSGMGVSSYDLIDVVAPQLSFLMLAGDGLGVMVKEQSLNYYKDDLTRASYTVEEYMKKNLAGMLNISGNMISVNLMSDIKETTIMGKKSYCADIVMSADGMDVYYTLYYVPNNKDSFISIVKISNEYLKNTVYDEAADQIINSIKLK